MRHGLRSATAAEYLEDYAKRVAAIEHAETTGSHSAREIAAAREILTTFKGYPRPEVPLGDPVSRNQSKPLNSGEAVHRLGYHPVETQKQQEQYERNRAMFMDLFDYIQNVGNPSREQALALTKLQESLMWLNAHVACNRVGVED
jgi:hypothetical protein